MTRRDLLGGAVAIGAVAVSGCTARPEEAFGGSPDGTDEQDPPDGGTTDPDPSEGGTTDTDATDGGTTGSVDGPADGSPGNFAGTSGIDDASIETLRTDCGSSDDDRITVAGDGSTAVVEGVLPAPNPCHGAVLEDATVDDATLSLVVDVVDTTGDNEACVMCLGAVSYRAEIELADSSVESVTVDHATGGRHTDTPVPGTPGDPTPPPGTPGLPTPVDDASVETVDSGCRTDEEAPIAVTFGDDVITITGTLLTRNPCHEAVIESITAEGDRLSIGVGVHSRTEEDTACVDCLGAISYEVRIELAEQSGITTVAVDHTPGDGTTVTR
jgi:hypothetical protein